MHKGVTLAASRRTASIKQTHAAAASRPHIGNSAVHTGISSSSASSLYPVPKPTHPGSGMVAEKWLVSVIPRWQYYLRSTADDYQRTYVDNRQYG